MNRPPLPLIPPDAPRVIVVVVVFVNELPPPSRRISVVFVVVVEIPVCENSDEKATMIMGMKNDCGKVHDEGKVQ